MNRTNIIIVTIGFMGVLTGIMFGSTPVTDEHLVIVSILIIATLLIGAFGVSREMKIQIHISLAGLFIFWLVFYLIFLLGNRNSTPV